MSTKPNPNRALTHSQSLLFRETLQHYEHKRYRQALKCIDTILRRSPTHGETLAMKGLCLNALDPVNRKEEAYELVRKGVRCDLTSHVVWHVFGLLWRSDKNYEEASKCYTQALRFDPDNHQILRDQALLLSQLRKWNEVIPIRTKILEQNLGLKSSWLALAVATYMKGDYNATLKTLDSFLTSIKEEPEAGDYEHSELLLFRARVCAKAGDVEGALVWLGQKEAEGRIVDDLSATELRAEWLESLGQNEEAAAIYASLVDRNPDHKAYNTALTRTLGIDDADTAALLRHYDGLSTKYTRADLPRRRPLEFLGTEHGEWRARLEAYTKRMLEKGVPSAFAQLKPLCSDPAKRQVVGEMLERFLESEKKGEKEVPTTVLWTMYVLAQFWDYCGQYKKAIGVLEKAIEHTPTLPELYLMKAKVLKHLGAPYAASEASEAARALDLQDRFVNVKSVRYLLRAGRWDEALNTVSLFTKNDAPGGPIGDLHDMQALWYLAHDARSNISHARYGVGMKRWRQVEGVLGVWADDEFDFHGYCARKGTVWDYVGLLGWEDGMRGSTAVYGEACRGLVEIACLLSERPEARVGLSKDVLMDWEEMGEAERGKAVKKAKKRVLERVKKAEKAAVVVSEKDGEKKEEAKVVDDEGEKKKVDDDPRGDKLMLSETPLEDVEKYLRGLEVYCARDVRTWVSVFEWCSRQQVWGRAVEALKKAVEIDQHNERVRECLVKWRHADVAETDPALEDILPASTDLASFIESSFPGTSAGLLTAARSYRLISSNDKAFETLLKVVNVEGVKVGDIVKGYELVRTWGGDVEGYVRKAEERGWNMVETWKKTENGVDA
ncbi:hypothetical protein YB2330_005960 [Saitoella coloradoensis]